MTRFSFLISILIVAAFSGIARADESLPGEADYKLNVQDFVELVVDNDLNVDYTCSADSAGWAVFTCSPAKASLIMFNNNKSCLRIQVDSESKDIDNMPLIKVYSSALTKVVNSGDSLVRVINPAPVTQFKAHLIGNGHLDISGLKTSNLDAGVTTGKGLITVKGRSQKAKLHNVGTGMIDATGLASNQLKCIVMGGFIECNAGDNLTISGAGGKVVYHGTPSKLSNRSLGVKTEAVED